MGYKFFKSKQVKVFPCSNRGTYNSSSDSKKPTRIFDPESRLASEYNLTHILGRPLGKSSFVVKYESQVLTCVIDGYYFEISLNSSDLGSINPIYTNNLWTATGIIAIGKKTLDLTIRDAEELDSNRQSSLLYPFGTSGTGEERKLTWGSDSSNALDDNNQNFVGLVYVDNVADLPESSDTLSYTCLDLTEASNWLPNIHYLTSEEYKNITDAQGATQGGLETTNENLAQAQADIITINEFIGIDSWEGSLKDIIEHTLSQATEYTDNEFEEQLGTKDETYKATTVYGVIDEAVNSLSASVTKSLSTLKEAHQDDINKIESDIDTKVQELEEAMGGVSSDLNTHKLDAQTFNSWKETHEAEHANKQTAITSAINTAKQGAYDDAVAEAASLDVVLKTELQGEIDSDVATAIAKEVARSDAKAKELADAAQAAAKVYADTQDAVLKATIEGVEATAKASDATIAGVKKYAEENASGALKDARDYTDNSLATEATAREEADNALDDKITTLRNDIGSLTNVMNFRGIFTTSEEVLDPVVGDVIILKDQTKKSSKTKAAVEYVYTRDDAGDGSWEEIGTCGIMDIAVEDLQKRVDSLESTVTSLEGTIASLESTINELKKCINGVHSVDDGSTTCTVCGHVEPTAEPTT